MGPGAAGRCAQHTPPKAMIGSASSGGTTGCTPNKCDLFQAAYKWGPTVEDYPPDSIAIPGDTVKSRGRSAVILWGGYRVSMAGLFGRQNVVTLRAKDYTSEEQAALMQLGVAGVKALARKLVNGEDSATDPQAPKADPQGSKPPTKKRHTISAAGRRAISIASGDQYRTSCPSGPRNQPRLLLHHWRRYAVAVGHRRELAEGFGNCRR